MLYEITKALDDPNGIIEDIWIRIVNIVGDKDPSINGVSCFGGRYYVTDAQRNRLRYMIPFLEGDEKVGNAGTQALLALPAHMEEVHPSDIRCGHCKGPFHPATGHAFSAITVACGPCYGRFAAWQMKKYGWQPITPLQLKRINKKKNKAIKKSERAAKAQEKQAAREASDYNDLYGMPRTAQSANPIQNLE